MTQADGRSPVVVDTGVFAAGLTARSLPLDEHNRPLLVGHEPVITFQTIRELYFGPECLTGSRRGDVLSAVLPHVDSTRRRQCVIRLLSK